MKIAIITRHAITNYGSLLQTFATEEILRDLGVDVITIDYVRSDETPENATKLLLKKSKRWNKNAFTRAVYYLVQQPDHVFAGRRFRKFQKEWLSLSEKGYSSIDELKQDVLDADVFCTGSDQVWGNIGSEEYDPAYFLEFVPRTKKRISIAASLGISTLSDNAERYYKVALDSYYAITVREKSAFDLISDITTKEIHQILDPTLLYEKKRWEQKIESMNLNGYVLLYQLNANLKMDSYAENFAKKVGKTLLRVSPELHNGAKSGKFVFLPTPGQFLYLIKNADYMITDSFHGTAFAITFNTQFIDVFPPEKSTRNRSILELTGLMDRVLTSFDDYSFSEKRIDFTHVNEIIHDERIKSLDIIRNMIF